MSSGDFNNAWVGNISSGMAAPSGVLYAEQYTPAAEASPYPGGQFVCLGNVASSYGVSDGMMVQRGSSWSAGQPSYPSRPSGLQQLQLCQQREHATAIDNTCFSGQQQPWLSPQQLGSSTSPPGPVPQQQHPLGTAGFSGSSATTTSSRAVSSKNPFAAMPRALRNNQLRNNLLAAAGNFKDMFNAADSSAAGGRPSVDGSHVAASGGSFSVPPSGNSFTVANSGNSFRVAGSSSSFTATASGGSFTAPKPPVRHLSLPSDATATAAAVAAANRLLTEDSSSQQQQQQQQQGPMAQESQQQQLAVQQQQQQPHPPQQLTSAAAGRATHNHSPVAITLSNIAEEPGADGSAPAASGTTSCRSSSEAPGYWPHGASTTRLSSTYASLSPSSMALPAATTAPDMWQAVAVGAADSQVPTLMTIDAVSGSAQQYLHQQQQQQQQAAAAVTQQLGCMTVSAGSHERRDLAVERSVFSDPLLYLVRPPLAAMQQQQPQALQQDMHQQADQHVAMPCVPVPRSVSDPSVLMVQPSGYSFTAMGTKHMAPLYGQQGCQAVATSSAMPASSGGIAKVEMAEHLQLLLQRQQALQALQQEVQEQLFQLLPHTPDQQ